MKRTSMALTTISSLALVAAGSLSTPGRLTVRLGVGVGSVSAPPAEEIEEYPWS